MSDIPTELSLDISQALAAIGEIDAALVAAATNFQASIDTSLSSLDIPPVDVPVDFDTTGLADVEAAIDEAGAGVVVPVDADTASAQEQIGSLEGEEVVVGVTADTSAAQADIASLGDAVSGAGSDFAAFGANARAGFDAAGAAVSGNVAGISGALGKLGPQAAGVGAALVTIVAAEKALVGPALEAAAAEERFVTTLGSAADIVRTIDVGGLNVDLQELALSLGSDDEAALNAASSIFQFGANAGEARADVAETTKEIEALAARAVALNPALGSVGDVAERLFTGLARGGRFANQFNISLTQTAITAEALRENVGKSADELTLYDKAAAGARLATQALGSSLATDIARGSENVQIQFNRVRQSFEETLEATGKPLLEPTLEILEQVQPVLATVAEAFSVALQVILPFANAILDVLVPALETVTPLLELAGKGASILGKAFEISLLPVTGPLRLISAGVEKIGDAFDDSSGKVEDGAAIIANALTRTQDILVGIGTAATTGTDLGEIFGEIRDEVAPLTADEAALRAEIARLTVGMAAGTVTAQQFRRVFNASGLDTEGFKAAISDVIAERNRLAASFQQGLPSIGDAFTVEAAKVSSGAKSIDRSFEALVSASDELRDRFTSNLPSIADAFTEGVKPEDLRDAQNTLEAFIQGVEGVSKSAADAAQAVIDKAAVEGGTGLAGFLETLRKQTAEIAAFQGTLAALRGRGASDLAATFAERGVESAAVAAEAAALSDTDLAAAEATVEAAKGVRADAVRNMGLFADELVATFGPKGAEAGAVFGEGLVTTLSDPAIVEQARKAAEAIGNATTAGAASSAAQPQTLSGFLAALKSQSADIQKFQANLDTIAENGGQVLADTLRQQGIDAATAAAQGAALAPAQLVAAEQAVRDAQTVLAQAESDNEAAADRLVQFTANTAARAAAGFTDAFVVDIGPTLGAIGGQILDQSTGIIRDASNAGILVGTAFGVGISDAAIEALKISPAAALFGAITGANVTVPPAAFTLQTTPTQAGFGTGTPAALIPGGPQVVIEQVNVTAPQGASADEQADAVAESLAWRIRGAR